MVTRCGEARQAEFTSWIHLTNLASVSVGAVLKGLRPRSVVSGKIDCPCWRAVLVARLAFEQRILPWSFGMLQGQISAALVPNTGAQVAILLLSLFLAASQLFQVLLGSAIGLPGWIGLGAHAALLLACSLLLELLDHVTLSGEQNMPWLEAGIAFTVAGAVIALHWIVTSGRMVGIRVSSRVARGVLVTVCAVAAGWSAQQFCNDVTARGWVGVVLQHAWQLQEVREQVAVTDAGRRIPLYRWEVSDAEFASIGRAKPPACP